MGRDRANYGIAIPLTLTVEAKLVTYEYATVAVPVLE